MEDRSDQSSTWKVSASAPRQREQAIERGARDAVIRRVARLQLAGIVGHVATDGDQLVIDLAPTDPDTLEHARALIARTGHLELHIAEPGSALMQALAEHVRTDAEAARVQITASRELWKTPGGETITDWALYAQDRDRDGTWAEARRGDCTGIKVSADDRVSCRDTGAGAIAHYVAELAKTDPRMAIPDDRKLGYEHLSALERLPARWRTHLLERRVVLTGRSIRRATPHKDPDFDRWTIELDLDREGTTTFATETASHVGRKLAFVLDGVVASAPVLESPVENGHLTLYFGANDRTRSEDEARDLAIVLTAGELPAPVREEIRAKLVDGVPRD